jgi:osmoprotectant transport system permease protein
MTDTVTPDAVRVPTAPAVRGRRSLLTPVLIIVIGVLYLVYVENAPRDSIERRSLSLHYISQKIWEHVELTIVSTVLVLLIAIPLGVLLSRSWMRRASPFVLALANIGQSAPAVGVVVLLALKFGIGFWTAIAALVGYGVLPALRNTLVGLQQVDPALVDAGRGIGMSAAAVLFKVEVPLATPVILAGVRTTLVLMIGVASIASFINGGGLGDLVTTGVSTQRTLILVTGCVLIALLALLVDWLGGLVTRLLAPKGLTS